MTEEVLRHLAEKRYRNRFDAFASHSRPVGTLSRGSGRPCGVSHLTMDATWSFACYGSARIPTKDASSTYVPLCIKVPYAEYQPGSDQA